MEVKDLMIGDWVQIPAFNYKTAKVTNIYTNTIWTDVACGLQENEFEPVLLTEEILEKNGFVTSVYHIDFPTYELSALDKECGKFDGKYIQVETERQKSDCLFSPMKHFNLCVEYEVVDYDEED